MSGANVVFEKRAPVYKDTEKIGNGMLERIIQNVSPTENTQSKAMGKYARKYRKFNVMKIPFETRKGII